MEKLMKPAEYARELGISRQAVYAKIKKGILLSKNVEGKLYIVIEGKTKMQTDTASVSKDSVKTKTLISSKVDSYSQEKIKAYKALLEAKDETISVLKGTVKDIKKSNKQISTTLRGEIDLLKEAFHEMRTLYINQLEHKRHSETIEVGTQDARVQEEQDKEQKEHWVGIKKFLKLQNITKDKQKRKTSKRLKQAFKSGDERTMRLDGKIKLNANEDYGDIVQ